MYMIQTVLQIKPSKITDIKTLRSLSLNTHLRQYAYGEVLHKCMITPYKNL